MSEAVSQAAKTAALAETRLGFHLHAAAMPGATREDIAHHLERAFRIWRPLQRAMAELEQIAPNTARQAEQEDNLVIQFVERRG